MKYIFKQIETDIYGKETGAVITSEFQTDTLDEMFERFKDFLNGCSFVIRGNIEEVAFEEYSDHGGGSTLEDYELHEPIHSEFYFDTERNK